MRILLLYPRFPDTFWSLRHALKFMREKALVPPLGLLTVAAMLPRQWELRLVDLNVQTLQASDLAWADYVFVSAMDLQRKSVAQVLARCRSAGVPVVAGGPLFTSQPNAFPDIEHLVLNEAELTLPPFLADLAAGHPQRVYTTTQLADLAQSPVPLWTLADSRYYNAGAVQYSRGCPYDCEFCDVTTLFGRRPRLKNPAQVVAELDAMRAAGWRASVLFVDDNLIGHRAAARDQLLPALIRWQETNGPTPLMTQVSLNLSDDPELMGLMSHAGFDTVFVGIETSDPAALAECGKTPNLRRDVLESVRRLQRAGLQVQAGFIVGFDVDTRQVFRQQVDFIQSSGIATAMVGMLQAFPGTRLFRRLRAEGRLTGNPSGDNADATTNIVPSMGAEALRAGYRWLIETLYAPKAYYRRVKRFLREYRRPSIEPKLKRDRLAAFFRSVLRLGVIGRERWQYWKLLAWTLFHRPGLFPVAISLAISGHHLRRVGEEQLVAAGPC